MEIQPTFWNIISATAIIVLLSIATYRILRMASANKIRKHNMVRLNGVISTLTKGMTIEEVESKHGYFDNIELAADAAIDKQYCHLGKDNGTYLTMVFENNMLNSWKLVA